MDYVVVEDYGTNIMAFLEKEFENYTLLEHFQSFFRFKINSNVSVGKLFGCFEDLVAETLCLYRSKHFDRKKTSISPNTQ